MKHAITKKVDLNNGDYLMEVEAPNVAEKFQPGNFVILMTREKGERIPMSVQKAEDGKVSLFIKRLGKTSKELDRYKVGDSFFQVIGPLGIAPEMKKYGNVAFCSDLVCGHAENYAFCKGLSEIEGNNVISIQTFPSEGDIYPESELTEHLCDEFYLTTVDGSKGRKGHYLDIVKELLEERKIDYIFAGGDLSKLRDLGELTKPYLIPTIITVRQIMIDGTGMCGSCRVFVDGEMKLTCIDGPMFDVHKLNFEDILHRVGMYKGEECKAMTAFEKQ
ncbi:sulfide/dihydroorotate dehydrogenase-like FAD/NAD-binding protein [bacterium]|nr:sulfide/dihydroorotate dehydrogenase-like FAD/NAD-binding protein [bacterium]